MGIRTLAQLPFAGKQVILRCDLNVPMKNGVISDDGRIRASLSTIELLLDNDCSIVIIAHLGRPKGEIKKELSLEPVAKRLGTLLDREVRFSSEILGLRAITDQLKSGEFWLLENIRFLESETSKVQEVRQLQAGRTLRRQRKMGRVERALHTREKNSRKGLKHALNTR